MNEKFLEEANLKIKFSEESGESLYAIKQFKKDTVIFEDVPIISYLLPARNFIDQTHCANCFKKELTVTCSCCTLQYCSDDCQQTHFLAHWALCLGRNSLQAPRITSMHSKNKIISGYAIVEVISQILAKVVIYQLRGLDLQEAFSQVMHPYKLLLNTQNISCDFKIKEEFKKAKLFFLSSSKLLDFAEDLSEQIEYILTLDFYKLLVSVIALNNCSVILQDELVGIAVYTLGSKFNHSCQPNCIFKWTDTKSVEILTEKDITDGDELFISYINENLGFLERQKELKEGWSFTCKCQKCKNQEIEQQKE